MTLFKPQIKINNISTIEIFIIIIYLCIGLTLGEELKTSQPTTDTSCKVLPFHQTFLKKGCIPAVAENNLCVGECGSFYLPMRFKTFNTTRITNTFLTCKQCFPDKYEARHVTLKCPSRLKKKRIKKFVYIKSCKCILTKCSVKKGGR